MWFGMFLPMLCSLGRAESGHNPRRLLYPIFAILTIPNSWKVSSRSIRRTYSREDRYFHPQVPPVCLHCVWPQVVQKTRLHTGLQASWHGASHRHKRATSFMLRPLPLFLQSADLLATQRSELTSHLHRLYDGFHDQILDTGAGRLNWAQRAAFAILVT